MEAGPGRSSLHIPANRPAGAEVWLAFLSPRAVEMCSPGGGRCRVAERSLAVMVAVLAVLCVSGCRENVREPSANKTPAAATSAAATGATFEAANYCKLYELVEDQLEGDPYDADVYAVAVQSMNRAARSGPPDLADEWSVVIEAFEALEAAAAEADLAELSEITLYEVNRARAGEGPWPDGLNRQAVEEFDEAIAAAQGESVDRADHAISDAARKTCEFED